MKDVREKIQATNMNTFKGRETQIRFRSWMISINLCSQEFKKKKNIRGITRGIQYI